jgi:hypothetical protein
VPRPISWGDPAAWPPPSAERFIRKGNWVELGPPAACSNSYLSGQTCITQHEQWWDDNGHAYGLQLDRTQYIARGFGMAFEIRQTYPTTWAADGRYYWTW